MVALMGGVTPVCTAQPITFTAKILSTHGQPVEGAHIYIPEHEELLISGRQGTVSFVSGFSRVTIHVSHIGFDNYTGYLLPTIDSINTIFLKTRVQVLDSVVVRPPDVWVTRALAQYEKTRLAYTTAAEIFYEEYATHADRCLGFTQGRGFLISQNKDESKPTWSGTDGVVFEAVVRSEYAQERLPYGYPKLRVAELFHAKSYWFEFVKRMVNRAKPIRFSRQAETEPGLIRVVLADSASDATNVTFLINVRSGSLSRVILKNPAQSLWVGNRQLWTKSQLKKEPAPTHTIYEVLLADVQGLTQVVGMSYEGVYTSGFQERVGYRTYKSGRKGFLQRGLSHKQFEALSIISAEPVVGFNPENWNPLEFSFTKRAACYELRTKDMALTKGPLFSQGTPGLRASRSDYIEFQKQFLQLLNEYFK
jgi:hypothetical protein